jgi:hypothetical protein
MNRPARAFVICEAAGNARNHAPLQFQSNARSREKKSTRLNVALKQTFGMRLPLQRGARVKCCESLRTIGLAAYLHGESRLELQP